MHIAIHGAQQSFLTYALPQPIPKAELRPGCSVALPRENGVRAVCQTLVQYQNLRFPLGSLDQPSLLGMYPYLLGLTALCGVIPGLPLEPAWLGSSNRVTDKPAECLSTAKELLFHPFLLFFPLLLLLGSCVLPVLRLLPQFLSNFFSKMKTILPSFFILYSLFFYLFFLKFAWSSLACSLSMGSSEKDRAGSAGSRGWGGSLNLSSTATVATIPMQAGRDPHRGAQARSPWWNLSCSSSKSSLYPSSVQCPAQAPIKKQPWSWL